MDKTLKGYTMLALFQSGQKFPKVSTITKAEIEEINTYALAVYEKCKALREKATLNETVEVSQMLNHASDLVSWTEELFQVLIEEGRE